VYLVIDLWIFKQFRYWTRSCKKGIVRCRV